MRVYPTYALNAYIHNQGEQDMFRIPVNTNEITLMAGGPAEPVVKDRQTGELARDRETGQTMYTVHLLVMVVGDARPQVWPVKVAGEPSGLSQGQPVTVVGLVASDWENNGRHGTSFRATAIRSAASAPPAPRSAPPAPKAA
jgi:hypothetical protein